VSARQRPIVAIDGPAGAGKSTVARRVAERLGYVLVDTGSLYRTIALAAARQSISFDDAEAVSGSIRTPEISQGASKVSAVPRVRGALLEMQRAAGRAGGVVLEGRDIGSVVFPEAEVKVFLTASVEERARRRHAELLRAGTHADIDAVKGEVVERDRRDSTRPIAPLIRAKDAIVVDSSALDVDEVVEAIASLVRKAETAP
jgi:cytidylate kinase